jgi:hypothetical protein
MLGSGPVGAHGSPRAEDRLSGGARRQAGRLGDGRVVQSAQLAQQQRLPVARGQLPERGERRAQPLAQEDLDQGIRARR